MSVLAQQTIGEVIAERDKLFEENKTLRSNLDIDRKCIKELRAEIAKQPITQEEIAEVLEQEHQIREMNENVK